MRLQSWRLLCVVEMYTCNCLENLAQPSVHSLVQLNMLLLVCTWPLCETLYISAGDAGYLVSITHLSLTTFADRGGAGLLSLVRTGSLQGTIDMRC
jgi:hypothetical protein